MAFFISFHLLLTLSTVIKIQYVVSAAFLIPGLLPFNTTFSRKYVTQVLFKISIRFNIICFTLALLYIT